MLQAGKMRALRAALSVHQLHTPQRVDAGLNKREVVPLHTMGEFPSGQRGQTVNLLRLASVVRIHSLPP